MIELPGRDRGQLRQPRLLRLGQPQRQGRLHLLPRLLRRQPGHAPPAAAGRGRPQGRRVHGRRRRRPRPGPRRLREGRVPLGRPGGELRRVRRPGRTRPRASSRPTRSSSSATRPRTAPGATSTSRRARELRDGVVVMPTPSTASPDARPGDVDRDVPRLPRRPAQRAEGRRPGLRLRPAFTDLGERYLLEVEQRRPQLHEGRRRPSAPTATVTPDAGRRSTRSCWAGDVRGPASPTASIAIEGDAAALVDFLGLLDTFEFWFNIATP